MDKKVMKKIVTGTMAMVIGIGGLNYKNHILQKPVGLRADVIENAAAVSYSISINQATGGTIKAYKNGTDTETTGRQAGNKVDIKVYPDSGYYLSGMKYGTDSDSKLQWYYDDTTSLGFKMPEGNVTLTPIFAKIPTGADKKPENMMSAEVPVFKNGVRTSDRLYIPVEVRGVKDTYDTWTAPSYTVISKDGTKYIKNRDFTFTSVSEKDPNGIKHTMTFTGTAEPKSNDRGYVDYLANPVKGEQKITYLQHISSLSGDVTTTPAPTSKPTATPAATATPKPTTAPVATTTPSSKQYKISCSSNVSHGKVSVTEYGTNGAKEQRMAKAGNYVELTVSPDEGYYLKSVKITSKKDTTTELKVSWYDDADSFGEYDTLDHRGQLPELRVCEIRRAQRSYPQGSAESHSSGPLRAVLGRSHGDLRARYVRMGGYPCKRSLSGVDLRTHAY